MIRLRLLDGVSWEGTPLPGERVGALLAVLADEPAGVPDARLVEEIWPAAAGDAVADWVDDSTR